MAFIAPADPAPVALPPGPAPAPVALPVDSAPALVVPAPIALTGDPAPPPAVVPAPPPAVVSHEAVASQIFRLLSAARDISTMRPTAYPLFVVEAMQIVDKTMDLPGPDKKEVVVLVLEMAVASLPDGPARDDLGAFVRVAPGLIDTIIAATRRQWNINVSSAKNWLFGCCKKN